MDFPLNFWDISIWLAVTAVLMLVVSEMLSPRYGKVNIQLDRKRLYRVALAVTVLFLLTVAMKIYVVVSNLSK